MAFSEINLLSLASGADWRVWLLQAHSGAAEEAIWGALEEAHPFLCWCQDWEGMWGACSAHVCTDKYAVPYVLEFSIWCAGRSNMDLSWLLPDSRHHWKGHSGFCLETESIVGGWFRGWPYTAFTPGREWAPKPWWQGRGQWFWSPLRASEVGGRDGTGKHSVFPSGWTTWKQPQGTLGCALQPIA